MGAVLDLLGFMWSIIKGFVDSVIAVVNFIKDLVLYLPNYFNQLPIEISIMLISVLSIAVAIFIYKFIK